VVLEVVYGLLSKSMALSADAGHNMNGRLGLGVAWSAALLVKRAPTQRFTYGLGGMSVLAALFNAAFEKPSTARDWSAKCITLHMLIMDGHPTHTPVTRFQTLARPTTVTPGTPLRCFATNSG
jgi:Cation efflux family